MLLLLFDEEEEVLVFYESLSLFPVLLVFPVLLLLVFPVMSLEMGIDFMEKKESKKKKNTKKN